MLVFVETQSVRIFYCFLTVVRVWHSIAIGPDSHFGLDGLGHDPGAYSLWQGEFYIHLIEFFGQLLAAQLFLPAIFGR